MKNIFYCVEKARMHLDQYHTRMYQKLVQLGIDQYRKLQFKTEPKVKVYRFTPNAAMLADLPGDYDFWTKVGIRCGGKLLTLSVNHELAMGRKEDDCGNEVADSIACGCCSDKFNYQIGWVPYYRNGQFVGEQFSVGGGANPYGYFNINDTLQQIELMNVPRVELEMEYVGTGGDDGETILPLVAADVVTKGIIYDLAIYDTRMPSDQFIKRQNAYTAALADYEKITNTPNISEIMSLLNETSYFKLG